jgi:hypothetical protein
MKDEYFEWLINLSDGHDFRYIYSVLYSIEYKYSIKSDQRCDEYGLCLRDLYRIQERKKSPRRLPKGSTVLELIIALAKICVSRQHLPMTERRICDFVEYIIDNLNLSYQTDDSIKYRIDRFMNRDYGEDLEYCMFPSDNDNLEDIDLYFQLMMWLDEKFR